MKRLLMFLVILGVAGVGARAQYREVPDIPTDLLGVGPATRLPWDIVDNTGGIYSVVLSLPPLTPVDAIHELPTGDWLVSVEVATDLAFVTWDRRDVILWDGGVVYAAYPPYGGALALIPLGSNVDAVLLDQTAAVVVSFDVPTTIGPVTYDPADLVRYNGVTFDAVPYFDASAAGIPVTANLTAGDRTGGLTVFSLDVPTAVGVATALPGVILSWNGAILGVFDPQPGWPFERSSRVNALTLPPVPAGTNPGAMANTLAVARLGAAMLRLSWTASDCAGGDDTGIYEGTIASLLGGVYDHTLIDCADGFPFLEEDIALPVADSYFLLSAHSDLVPLEEGSYGLDNIAGFMSERPAGAATCVPVQALGCP